MTKNIKTSLIFLFLISVGYVVGHYHGADTMEKFSSDFMKEMEAELYYQSLENHKKIYEALDLKEYKAASGLLEKRMRFEFKVVEKCVSDNCLVIGVSDVNKTWVDENRSNKALKSAHSRSLGSRTPQTSP